jgi:hypothetical protein
MVSSDKDMSHGEIVERMWRTKEKYMYLPSTYSKISGKKIVNYFFNCFALSPSRIIQLIHSLASRDGARKKA